MSWGRADLNTRGHWLLDLTIEGQVHRFSDQALEITDAAGDVWAYEEGLSDILVTRSRLAEERASIAVTIASVVDWSALVGRNASLERQPAKLLRWWEGMTLEQALVMLDGFTTNPVMEKAGDPLTISIVRHIPGRSFAILEEDGVVDRIAYPNSAGASGTYKRDRNINGQFIPVVIGRPGLVPVDVSSESLPASPALLTKFSTDPLDTLDQMVIGWGQLECADETAGIRLWDVSEQPPVSGAFDTLTVTNAIGQVVTVAKLGAGKTVGGVAVAHGRQYWAAFRRVTVTKGGTVDPRTGNLLRGAGSLMLWLLEQFTSEPIDVGRMLANAEILDTVLIDAYINDGDIKPREWIAQHLMPLLPISPVWGLDGFYYEIRRWDATAIDAIARFDADSGGNCEQAGPTKPAGTEIYNRFAIAYRHDRDKGRYNGRIFVRANPDDADSRKHGNLLCRRSEADHGLLRSPTIKSAVLWDESSAIQSLNWKVLEHAWPKRLVTIALPPEWEVLHEGDVVLYNNTDASIIDQPALVTTVQIGDPNQVVCELHLLDHPVHTVHTV